MSDAMMLSERIKTDLPLNDDARRIIDRLKAARSVWLLGHVRPDLDCYGAEIGLARALVSLGKTVRIGNSDKIPDRYEPLEPGCDCRQWNGSERLTDFDEIVLIDASDPARIGVISTATGWRTPLVIDHHEASRPCGELNWVLPAASSSSAMIFRFLSEFGVRPDAMAARALLGGIQYDTGYFCYSNTRASDFDIAARLMELGAIPIENFRMMKLNRTDVEMAMETCARASLENYRNGSVSVAMLTLDDFSATGARSEDVSELHTIPRERIGNKVGVLITEPRKGFVKASMRSDGSVDVAAVCRQFGGGGHKQSSGCEFDGVDIQTVKARILKALGA